MSRIAIVRAVDFSPEECERLAQELGDASSDNITFIVTSGGADTMTEEEFVEHLDQLAEVAGYTLEEE